MLKTLKPGNRPWRHRVHENFIILAGFSFAQGRRASLV